MKQSVAEYRRMVRESIEFNLGRVNEHADCSYEVKAYTFAIVAAAQVIGEAIVIGAELMAGAFGSSWKPRW